MGKINAKKKGSRVERLFRDFLREHWNCADAIRGRQNRGGIDSPDVINGVEGTHVEVKGRTQQALSFILNLLEKAKAQCTELDNIPILKIQITSQEPVVIFYALDAEAVARLVGSKEIKPGLCWLNESKAKLSVWAHMSQAIRDAGETNIPYVSMKPNNKPWMIMVRQRDFRAFCGKLVSQLEDND